MKKKKIILILLLILIVLGILTYFLLIPLYKGYKEDKKQKEEEERIKNAKIVVNLTEERKIPFNEENIHISDFITEINGDLIEDELIDTSEVGTKKISFEYINEDGIKIPYDFTIEIIDTVSPSIWLGALYTVYTGYNGNLIEDITCADDYDDNPRCEIVGEYDMNIPGNYNLQFVATDASNNQTIKEFTLRVINKPTSTPTPSQKEINKVYLNDVIDKYKNENTKIGIDISRWQGDIDFQAVKDAGVEFVFIKVGGTLGIKADYYVDRKFIDNIEGFNEVGIPVGIYIYSYVSDKEDAINDANWVLEQIKPYKIDLPIVYDWENWSFYNEFHHSFNTLTKNAEAFLDVMVENGYTGAIYSSKNYLEKAWLKTDYDIWLAHYTDETNYEGKYKYWQMCETGVVEGINALVDIDIMYLDK